MAHSEIEILEENIEQAAQEVIEGELYTHYKNPNRKYRVLGFAIREEDEEVSVNYQRAVGSSVTFNRKLRGDKGWLTPVEVNGKTIPRFTRVDK